jgi:hypothetical protein
VRFDFISAGSRSGWNSLQSAPLSRGLEPFNTMGMISEAIGLAPLGSSIIPAVFAERAAVNRRAGRVVTEAVLRGTPLPRDIVTRKALDGLGTTQDSSFPQRPNRESGIVRNASSPARRSG